MRGILALYIFCVLRESLGSAVERQAVAEGTCMCTEASSSRQPQTQQSGGEPRTLDSGANGPNSGADVSESKSSLLDSNANMSSPGGASMTSSAAVNQVPTRQVLLERIASLCNGGLSAENAEIALSVLETALETGRSSGEGNSFETEGTALETEGTALETEGRSSNQGGYLNGHRLVLSVINSLVQECTKQFKRKAEHPGWEVDAWVLLAASTAGLSPDEERARWDRIFKSGFVTLTLEQLAKRQLEQMIVSIMSDRTQVYEDDVNAAFRSLMGGFGFWNPKSPLSLHTAEGRDVFHRIVGMLRSEPRLRLQVDALSRLFPCGYSQLNDGWRGVFLSPQLDGLDASGGRRDPESVRQSVLRPMWNKVLANVPTEILCVLVDGCVRELGSVSDMGVGFSVSRDEALFFIGATVESFFTYDGTDRTGLISFQKQVLFVEPSELVTLFEQVFTELRKPEFRTVIVGLRALPLTLWFQEWGAFFDRAEFSGVRQALERRIASQREVADRVRQNHEERMRKESERVLREEKEAVLRSRDAARRSYVALEAVQSAERMRLRNNEPRVFTDSTLGAFRESARVLEKELRDVPSDDLWV